MSGSASKSEIDVKPIDEGALTKGQLRKLNALRKSVGNEIGERAFAEWFASQAKAEKADKNLETIVDALWPFVQQGKLQIRRGGYLVRRGRGRLIVEPQGLVPSARVVRGSMGDTKVQEDLRHQRKHPREDEQERKDEARPKRHTWRGLFGGGRVG